MLISPSQLRRTITADTAKVARLRRRLGELRSRAGQPSQAPGAAARTAARTSPGQPKFAPINNQPPSQLLEEARRKKTSLLKSLDYGAKLPDGGAAITKKLEQVGVGGTEHCTVSPFHHCTNSPLPQVDEDIERLEREAAAAGGAFTNAGWNKYRQQQHTGVSIDEMLRQFTEQPGDANLLGGRMTAARKQEVRTVTHEAMASIHAALETMPAEADEEEQPAGLRRAITLFPHQLHALAWLLWREAQEACRGGILADDMGLGKTLTMISLILKHREVQQEKDEDKENVYQGKLGSLVKSNTTLIVCPASLLGQWSGEVESKVIALEFVQNISFLYFCFCR